MWPSPTYTSGRLTKEDLSASSVGSLRGQGGALRKGRLPTDRVASGRISKKERTTTKHVQIVSVESSTDPEEDEDDSEDNVFEEQDEDYDESQEEDEDDEEPVDEGEGEDDEDSIDIDESFADQSIKFQSGYSQDIYRAYMARAGGAGATDPGEIDVDKEEEDDPNADYGSDSDWDNFPRVRRRIPVYNIRRLTTAGNEQWTPFESKLHKLVSLVEGYPVMENDWKFPYFREWAIPLSDEHNSPLSPPEPPAVLNKRVALKATNDLFRALKALKRLFALSSHLAAYRQLDNMERFIAPTIEKEVKLYMKWAMQDAGLDKKEYLSNVVVAQLPLDGDDQDGDEEDDDGDDDDGDDDDGDDDDGDDDDGDDDGGDGGNGDGDNGDGDDGDGDDGDGGNGNGGGGDNGAVASGAVPGGAVSGGPSIGAAAAGASNDDNAADDEQRAAEENRQRARDALERVLESNKVRAYAERYRDHLAARIAGWTDDPGSLDLVLFLIVQHRVLLCTLDASKADALPTVISTFNMADTSQWLWNAMSIAIPIHLARDELLRLDQLGIWDGKVPAPLVDYDA